MNDAIPGSDDDDDRRDRRTLPTTALFKRLNRPDVRYRVASIYPRTETIYRTRYYRMQRPLHSARFLIDTVKRYPFTCNEDAQIYPTRDPRVCLINV